MLTSPTIVPSSLAQGFYPEGDLGILLVFHHSLSWNVHLELRWDGIPLPFYLKHLGTLFTAQRRQKHGGSFYSVVSKTSHGIPDRWWKCGLTAWATPQHYSLIPMTPIWKSSILADCPHPTHLVIRLFGWELPGSPRCFPEEGDSRQVHLVTPLFSTCLWTAV